MDGGNDLPADRVPSEYDDIPSSPGPAGSLPPGRDISPHGEQRGDVPERASNDAPARAPQPGRRRKQDHPTDHPDASSDPRFLALIHAEQNLHLPVEFPDPFAAAELRERAPEVYQLWVSEVRRRAKNDEWIERAPYQLPYRLGLVGALAGLIGLVVMAGLAGLAIVKGQPWVASLFAVLDFVGVVAAFSNQQQAAKHRGDPPD